MGSYLLSVFLTLYVQFGGSFKEPHQKFFKKILPTRKGRENGKLGRIYNGIETFSEKTLQSDKPALKRTNRKLFCKHLAK
jgi:hypothetical protein